MHQLRCVYCFSSCRHGQELACPIKLQTCSTVDVSLVVVFCSSDAALQRDAQVLEEAVAVATGRAFSNAAGQSVAQAVSALVDHPQSIANFKAEPHTCFCPCC